MEGLVFRNGKGNDVTTSLLIAETFDKRHDNVLRDIENLDCSNEFRLLNFEFMFNVRELPNGGKKKEEYYEITKDGFSFLALGYTGSKAGKFKETFISEFNKREQLLKNDEYILERAYGILTERTRLLEQTIKTQAPKVEYYNKVLNADGLFPIKIIAAQLGMTANKLNVILKDEGVQYKLRDSWNLTAKYVDKGYANLKTHPYMGEDGNVKTAHQLQWTEKGKEFIIELLSKQNKAA